MAKKKIKIKFTNIFLLIIVIYILVQIILWTIGYFTRTMVLDEEDINLQVKEKGLVVMNETLVKAEDDGIIKYDIDSDEKIQNNKLLFTISKSNTNEKINEKIEVLENEIKDLEKKEKNKSSNIILNKKEELKILKNQKQTYYIDYKSPISGVALFKYDNNFNISADQLDDIDSKILDSIENNFISIDTKDHIVNQDDVVLRLIDLNQVYICIFQDKNKEIFKEGQDVKVVVNGSEIDAKVEKIYNKKSEDVVAIKIMEQNTIIYNTRVQEFGIIYKKIQGFKIPIESVVEKNKKLGVYVHFTLNVGFIFFLSIQIASCYPFHSSFLVYRLSLTFVYSLQQFIAQQGTIMSRFVIVVVIFCKFVNAAEIIHILFSENALQDFSVIRVQFFLVIIRTD